MASLLAGPFASTIKPNFRADPNSFSREKSLRNGDEIALGLKREPAQPAVFDFDSQFDRIRHVVLREFFHSIHSQHDAMVSLSLFNRERGERFSHHGEAGFLANLFRRKFQ